jgi:excisionase family DNA binding protein
LKEVADLLRVSARTVQRLLSGGELSAVRVGRSIRFERDDVEQFIQSRKVGA